MAPLAALAMLLASPVRADPPSPGQAALERVRGVFVQADLRAPLDLARFPASDDPDLKKARAAAQALQGLRGTLTSDKPEPVKAAVRQVCAPLSVEPAACAGMEARYEALRASLRAGGAAYDPRSNSFRGADGKPMDAAAWNAHAGRVRDEDRARAQSVMNGAASLKGDDNGGVGGTGSGGETPEQAIARYTAQPAGPKVHVAGKPPAVPGQRPGVREQAVSREANNLSQVLGADNLHGYMTPKDKQQIVDAWRGAVGRHVSVDGRVDYAAAVNDFQNNLLTGREAGTATRAAEHWAEITAGTYNLGTVAGPPAAMGASLLWNTFSVTKSQLVRSYRYLRGQGPLPPAGNYWGETMNQSLVTESAAAGWASTLPNPHRTNIVAGTAKTLKLDEIPAAVSQDGVGGFLRGLRDRYFGK